MPAFELGLTSFAETPPDPTGGATLGHGERLARFAADQPNERERVEHVGGVIARGGGLRGKREGTIQIASRARERPRDVVLDHHGCGLQGERRFEGRERRIVVHFVDLRKKPIAPGELRRFTDRLGAAALLDTESRPYREQGLAYLSTDATGINARLLADPRLIRLPLVRYGDEVTAGKDEAAWKAWLAKPRQ